MAYWETDLTTIFSTETPGAYSSTYTPLGGSASTIVVLMDQEEAEQNNFDEINVISLDVTARANSSDVPSIAFGDSLVIDSVSYLVREFFSDSTGITFIKLEQV